MTDPVTLWRIDYDIGAGHRFDPYRPIGSHPKAHTAVEYRALPRAEYDALYAEVARLKSLASRPPLPASVERRAAYMGVEALRDEVARLKALLVNCRTRMALADEYLHRQKAVHTRGTSGALYDLRERAETTLSEMERYGWCAHDCLDEDSNLVVGSEAWKVAEAKVLARIDAALVVRRLAFELDGGAHAAGKRKVRTDTERRGLAAAHGWRVVAMTPEQVRDGTALGLVRAALGGA